MRPVNDVTGSGLSVMRADGPDGLRLSASAEARANSVNVSRTRGFACHSPINSRSYPIGSCAASGGFEAAADPPRQEGGVAEGEHTAE